MTTESPEFLAIEDVLGLLAALVFLDLNGISVTHGSPGLYDLTLGVAEGRIGKEEAAATLQQIAQSY